MGLLPPLGEWEVTPEEPWRPEFPHDRTGTLRVHTLEEGARSDRPGETGTSQELQGRVATGLGCGEVRAHVGPPVSWGDLSAAGHLKPVIRPCADVHCLSNPMLSSASP